MPPPCKNHASDPGSVTSTPQFNHRCRKATEKNQSLSLPYCCNCEDKCKPEDALRVMKIACWLHDTTCSQSPFAQLSKALHLDVKGQDPLLVQPRLNFPPETLDRLVRCGLSLGSRPVVCHWGVVTVAILVDDLCLPGLGLKNGLGVGGLGLNAALQGIPASDAQLLNRRLCSWFPLGAPLPGWV